IPKRYSRDPRKTSTGMTALPAALVTLLLAYCFAAAGDLLLSRRSTSLLQWNESLLVGLSIMATGLFPLSILLPANALLLTLVCLIACGAIRCFSFKSFGIPE